MVSPIADAAGLGDNGRVDQPKLVTVDGVDLEVEMLGDGEPVMIIPTALTAEELRPLGVQLAAGGGYQVIHYHRRGYAGSGPAHRIGSVAAEAADCRSLMSALGVASAHVVGVSYSAAIALTLASTFREVVSSLTVVEPPPAIVPDATEFRAANVRLMEIFAADGPAVALEEFCTMLIGPDWRLQAEGDLPGSVAGMERDANTFFGSDLPAILDWKFGGREAELITCPVMYVGGGASGPWFDQVRARILELLPHAEDRTVNGAGHLLATTHHRELAEILVEHLRAQSPSDPA